MFNIFRQLQISSTTITNRPILQPASVLPIYTPHTSATSFSEQKHLPLIKERMVKANLVQKANFKCKSPISRRPGSSLSRSTNAVINTPQLQTKVYNPFKVFNKTHFEMFSYVLSLL